MDNNACIHNIAQQPNDMKLNSNKYCRSGKGRHHCGAEDNGQSGIKKSFLLILSLLTKAVGNGNMESEYFEPTLHEHIG